MKQKICQFILKIIGWKAVVTEEIPQKCIFCVAPHTSNLDFILGKIMFCAIGGKRPSFLIKKEWFIFPFGLIFNRIGGIPVDRSKKTSLVDQIVKRFEEQDRFHHADDTIMRAAWQRRIADFSQKNMRDNHANQQEKMLQ